MANQEHLEIIDRGADAANNWRKSHSDIAYDLNGADLSDRDLSHYNFSYSDLSDTNFSGSNLAGCNFNACILDSTNFESATIKNAKFINMNGSKEKHYAPTINSANFRRAKLDKVNISHCVFDCCDFTRSSINGSSIVTASFEKCIFRLCNFKKLQLVRVSLSKSEDLHSSTGLEKLSFDTEQVREFETSVRNWQEVYFSWENLRIVGRLPLFGASYLALVIIPVYFYGLDIYNQNIGLLRDWALQSTQQDNLANKYFAEFIIEKLYPLPVPTRSLAILVSTIFLAAGSTLYTIFCPSRIKEFSMDQWVDELNKSLVNYWPLSWKHRTIRLLSSFFYIVGATCLILILLEKLYGVFMYVIKYS
ncbi:MAG: pentapeptide repeat-containing protein [Candidatus Thiodiazotropha sp. (ex Lucina pensylvanica)]|nr:pentapeptide repeat-containing protein [Candidatus Thiodiazotropha sp. (ex Lucina pensylvanica)]